MKSKIVIDNNKQIIKSSCADCGNKIGYDDGPGNGWQLEDGRIICNACCVKDTKKIVNDIIKNYKSMVH